MNKRTRFLEAEEIEKVFRLAKHGHFGRNVRLLPNKRLYNILTIQLYLGLRISDILLLKEKNVHNGRLSIVEKKTGKRRERPLPTAPKFQETLKELLTGDPENALFEKVTERAIQKQLQKISEVLGIVDVSTHSMRKTYASTLLKATGSIEVVRASLGHSSIAMTQKYIGVSNKEVEEGNTNLDFDYEV